MNPEWHCSAPANSARTCSFAYASAPFGGSNSSPFLPHICMHSYTSRGQHFCQCCVSLTSRGGTAGRTSRSPWDAIRQTRNLLPLCSLHCRDSFKRGLKTYRGGNEARGLGDKKGLRGGTGGPGRVFGGGENGAGLYSFSLACREAAGPAADGSEPPVREPGTCKSFEHDARDG